ncbi:MAG: penicillin acylase family protein [Thermodesulfobacteriota bacterium]|nr:penicillin acylase family protein [Thermodesulfobacteriota bacterium]
MKKLGLSGWLVFILLLILTTTRLTDVASATVTVDRDDKGVWFITGSDDAPLYEVFKAMGHEVATDRLWQMELYRRLGTGRMAELFGAGTDNGFLETDIFVRTLGYSEAELEQAFVGMDMESQNVIQGYVDGINQRIIEILADPTALLPFEFTTLGIMPEPWTVNQVMAWTAVMQRSFDPEALDTGQLDNAELLARLSTMFGEVTGFAMFNDLRWSNDPAALSVIDHAPPRDDDYDNDFVSIAKPKLKMNPSAVTSRLKAKHERILASLEKVNARVKMGSYAWVLSGNNTRSGNPVIYSGPQMGFSVPSIVLEGSIRAGGLNISGMSVPGIPSIIIGRTPHHAWSIQVGHAHTTDYYFEQPAAVAFHRFETIKVAGQTNVILRVFRSGHGPVINPLPYDPGNYEPAVDGPIVSWKYAHWDYELNFVRGILQLARATSMDQFGDGISNLAVSQHFFYADRNGNIAYWMSGRDPVRPPGEWRLPQGTLAGVYGEWNAAVVKPLSTDRNTLRGWYGGWNNKANANYPSGFNGIYTTYGPFHRAHVLYDYLHEELKDKKLKFNKIQDLALEIATTDSFHGGGNPWKFVKKDFKQAVQKIGQTQPRLDALQILKKWDGHFVAGSKSEWVAGTEKAEAWVLMDQWIDEVIDMTFFDELAVPDSNGGMMLKESKQVLFNVLLHGLEYPGSLTNNYNWFQNLSDPSAPQDANSIIVAALDNVLAEWDSLPPEIFERGTIDYNHDLIGLMWQTPKSSRSTYAHCVEYGPNGPVRIESMFPLGESGHLCIDQNNPAIPIPDPHFFSMTPHFDGFAPREFPLF